MQVLDALFGGGTNAWEPDYTWQVSRNSTAFINQPDGYTSS